ncbi:S41 family peptidase [Pararhodonellum marinum]|uniref:S41 family peptidase n=1 Tax=Pararhodonellum marinum TaxID=2755358 RepID=UPI00188E5D9A|nr:S41 family peptidase [Pararhodonellum marinum]
MKKYFLLLSSILALNSLPFSAPVFSQKAPCTCPDEFEFLKSYIEKNHAAFGDNVNISNQKEYDEFVESVSKEIQGDPVEDHCIIYLKKYLAYFKDNHTQIHDMGYQVDENNEEALKQFFASTRFQHRERIELDLPAIEAYLNSENAAPMEGIYETQDGTYTVAVLKDQNDFRDFYGIILDSKTKIWEPGQVKFELKALGENRFQGYFYYKFYGLNDEEVRFDGNQLGTWIKKEAIIEEHPPFDSEFSQEQKLFEFKLLYDDLGYLSIKTFEGYFKSQLDSLFLAHEQELGSVSKLIIDVRGNGGGSDALLAPFIPMFYTDTLRTELPQLYATKDNLKTYAEFFEQIKSDSARYGKATIDHLRKLIKKMEAGEEGEYVNMFDSIEELGETMETDFGSQQFVLTNSMSEDNRYRLTYYNQEKPLPLNPEKIVLLMDRGCASTCENLILLANQSKKVITYGENSGGYKGYGNVFPIMTPMGYQLSMSTTRYEKESQYEFVGIPPMVSAEANEEWIARAIELLESK